MQLSRLVFLPCAAWVLLMVCGPATAQQLPEAPTPQSSGQKSTPMPPAKPAESSPPPQPAAQAAPQNSADQSVPPKEKVVIPAGAERHYRQGVLYEREHDVPDAVQ